MATIVDLQVVPGRIFEVVKERILANRAKYEQLERRADNRSGSRRPQRRRFNATPTEYKRPEPAATRDGGNEVMASAYTWETSPVSTNTPQDFLILPQRSWEAIYNENGDLPTADEALDLIENLDEGKKEYSVIPLEATPYPDYPGVAEDLAQLPESNPAPLLDNVYNDCGYDRVAWQTSTTSGISGYVSRSFFQSAIAGGEYYFIDAALGQGRATFNLDDTLCLPIEGDSMIVCRIRRRMRFSWSSIVVNKLNQLITYHTEPNGDCTFYVKDTENWADFLWDNVNVEKNFSQFTHRFVVNSSKVRVLDSPFPDPFREKLEKLYPYLSDYEPQKQGGGPMPIARFPNEDYQEDMAYGYMILKSGLQALPPRSYRDYTRHFGLGKFDFTGFGDHNLSNAFTPAVYKWLDGDLPINLEPHERTPYADLRRKYFRKAPNYYMDPNMFLPEGGLKRSVGFTRSTPVDETYGLRGAFYQKKWVPGAGGGVKAWDWGEPAYCKQELLRLGFTKEDFVP